jgi:FlaA1/EpsC-like NDP-sugar epimerase
MFKNKTLLIIGGTGSFGNAVLKHFINSDINEIRIFSRDEKKLKDLGQIEYLGSNKTGGYYSKKTNNYLKKTPAKK